MHPLRKFIILTIFFALVGKNSGQDLKNDLTLIKKNFHPKTELLNIDSKKVGLKPGRKINYLNPIYWLMRGAMFTYQNAISPQISANCTFQLSCSSYSKAAFAEGGIFLGVLMSTDRLTRCTHESVNETPGFYLDDAGKLIDEPQFYLKKY